MSSDNSLLKKNMLWGNDKKSPTIHLVENTHIPKWYCFHF